MKIGSRGFTLVELMIVIAIIGILAAALYPSYMSYLSNSRDTKRIMELRSVATIIGAYKQANDQQFPDTATGSTDEYCLTSILGWLNGSNDDTKYNDLLMNIKNIPRNTSVSDGVDGCNDASSLFYNRLEDAAGSQYAILAVHMETAQSITYLTGSEFLDNTKILTLMNNEFIKGLDIQSISPPQQPLYHILIN